MDILEGNRSRIDCADCLEWLRALPDSCVDLVVCSPPYEDRRTYSMGFKLVGQAWVDWAAERFRECVRVSRGLVAWVIEGKTQKFRWSATPAMLMADLHRSGVNLRKPPIFHRIGICGSGGPDWLRNDYEFIVCASRGGKLPWSDNTAMGHPPKWAPGGMMSNRHEDGQRKNQSAGPKAHARWGKNQWGHSINSGATVVEEGGVVRSRGRRPSHKKVTGRKPDGRPGKMITGRHAGDETTAMFYVPPVLANPGNLIQQAYTADELAARLGESSDVFHTVVGGGCMGDDLAHENEAPFPESLPEFFIRSFCPPNGIACDIFSGSGTTAAVALKWNRRFIGCDIRESQVELTKRRIAEIQPMLTAM